MPELDPTAAISQQPRFTRIFKNQRIEWNSNDGSIGLGEREYGKITIDCKLRLSDAKWGVLDHSRPAGVLYIDITFNQPAGWRLSSACIKITLDDYEETPPAQKGKGKEPMTITPSRLRLEKFGPTRLTGDPVTKNWDREISAQPQVGITGIADFGGVGPKWTHSGQYTSHWLLDGHTFTAKDKKRKIPGIAYRTIQWDLEENPLAYQQSIDRPNVIQTAFAFEHELKPFYIKVEIEGRLKDIYRRYAPAVFPGRLSRNQGTSITLVELNPSDEAYKEKLDGIVNTLEGVMKTLNLVPDLGVANKPIQHEGAHENGLDCDPVDEAQILSDQDDIALAKATHKFAPRYAKPGDRSLSQLSAPLSTTSTLVGRNQGSEGIPPASSPKEGASRNDREQEQLKTLSQLVLAWFYMRFFQLFPQKSSKQDWGKL
jgi:hypothetical protein